MKIFYVGDLNAGGTSGMRLRALQELGHDVDGFNVHPPRVWCYVNSLRGRIRRKLLGAEDLAGENRAIIAELSKVNYDLLWLDKALTITPATLRRVREDHPQCLIVGYSGDDMFARHNQSKQFLRHLPHYDLFCTTKSYGVSELCSLGCPRVLFVGNSYDLHTHRPVSLSAQEVDFFRCEVGFIGSYELARAKQLNWLANSGVRLKIFGSDWEQLREPSANLEIQHRAVYADEYAKAICGGKIQLCFLRKMNRDLQTTRTVEIPACGTFMLAERSPEHLEMFDEGTEAEFFDSNEELLDKTRFYLNHPVERERIASAGRERCLRSGYSYHDRLKNIMETVAQLQSDRQHHCPKVTAHG